MTLGYVSSSLRKSSYTLYLLTNTFCKRTHQSPHIGLINRFIQTSWHNSNKQTERKTVAIYAFNDAQKKERESFLDILHMYELQEPTKRGHVEFIKAAMQYMDEFGVNKDLEVYKKLLDVLPKGKFISSSPMQADFMHFPKQQQVAIDLLEQMEDNGVIGDLEMQELLLNIFGQHGIPLRRFWRMMYWMPKFRHLNPWPRPDPLPTDPKELAKLAIEKISSIDPQRELTVFETESVPDSIDKTWIVSAISPTQQEFLQNHPSNLACYVEGPFKVWIGDMAVDYFILRADPRDPPNEELIDADDITNIDVVYWNDPKAVYKIAPTRSVHDQEDMMIYSMCATGTSSKDSLLSWIRCLQRTNPILETLPILFTLTKQVQDRAAIESGPEDKDLFPQEKITDT